jgi:hypothetical protein
MPSSQIMNTPKPDQASDPPVAHAGPSHEEIARRAYQLWEERGGPHGSPEEDWHRAQRELRVRSGALPRRVQAGKKSSARAANAQLLHPKLKCGALDSKTSSRSVWPRYKPIASFEGAQDLSPLGLV